MVKSAPKRGSRKKNVKILDSFLLINDLFFMLGLDVACSSFAEFADLSNGVLGIAIPSILSALGAKNCKTKIDEVSSKC